MITKAFKEAARLHFGQKRRYSGNPYAEHPIEVKQILESVGIHDQNILAAALLHDVVEDCGVDVTYLQDNFNPEIAQYVMGMTSQSMPEDGNRKIRKLKDLAYIAKQSVEVKNIKLADIISNANSLIE